jgi:phage major head subunit gpT-like protein
VRSGTETVEITAANIFNNGFSSSYTGFDGKALFATDHPTLGGSTQANTPTIQADLSVSSLTAGLTAIEKYVDERGLSLPTKAVLLMVPVDSWNIAEELLGSEYKPLTSNIGAVMNMEKMWN